MRRYLQSKHELPAESLVALMPMSLRSDASAGGNAIGAAMVAIRSDIADPLSRLKAAHFEAGKGKRIAEKMGADLFATVFDVVPSFMGNFVLNKLLIKNFNMTISNVRGPDKPLYLAGAKAMCLYPISIPTNGAGLNITGVSYNGVMWVAAVGCRNILPDPGFFVQCMREEWEDLLAGADALKRTKTAAKAPTKAVSAKPAAKPAAKPVARKAAAPTARKKAG